MLIAQITDIHLGFDPGNPAELNRQRLDRVVAALLALDPLPDLLLATGDIAENGSDGHSYARFREALAGLPFPVFAAMGNHDDRAGFLAEFGDTPGADGFIQYAIEDQPVRILVLDTLEPGRHGGNFCAARAGWLKAKLAEAPDRPTLLVLHHPPIDTGHSWMTERPDAQWVRRLEGIVSAHPNIVALLAGHIHRPLVTRWAGSMVVVCPPTAPFVALDFARIDPARPDGRPMIIADDPGFALHRWNEGALVSHFETASDHPVLTRFTPKLQPLVRMLVGARRGD